MVDFHPNMPQKGYNIYKRGQGHRAKVKSVEEATTLGLTRMVQIKCEVSIAMEYLRIGVLTIF